MSSSSVASKLPPQLCHGPALADESASTFSAASGTRLGRLPGSAEESLAPRDCLRRSLKQHFQMSAEFLCPSFSLASVRMSLPALHAHQQPLAIEYHGVPASGLSWSVQTLHGLLALHVQASSKLVRPVAHRSCLCTPSRPSFRRWPFGSTLQRVLSTCQARIRITSRAHVAWGSVNMRSGRPASHGLSLSTSRL